MHRTDRSGSSERSAFTLIELLVVVAIIAILSAIAMPNFLGASVRAKVARAKADMRTIATALESYAVDQNVYPPGVDWGLPVYLQALRPLTTPIAYISKVPLDLFNASTGGRSARGRGGGDTGESHQKFAYGAGPVGKEARWILASVGPDLTFGGPRAILDRYLSYTAYQGYQSGMFYKLRIGPTNFIFDYKLYDPTNGSISRGEIVRASDFQVD